MNSKKGIFITFEGSEGCGKSTQSRLLAQYLSRRDFEVVYLREPGGTRIGEKLRAILLSEKHHAMSAECEMLLYMAARAQIVAEVIKPALERGSIVICDRFLDSTLAYQGFGLGIDISMIRLIGDFAVCGVKPDLTILMDLALEKGLKHRQFTKDRIEQRSREYHCRVRAGYLKLARQESARIKVVRVANDKSVTQEHIRTLVAQCIGRNSS